MNIDKRDENGVVILLPDGRLDSNTAPLLDSEIDSVNTHNGGHHLLIDFTKVEYISSAGLRVILKAVKERKTSPKSFAVSCLQDHVKEVFEISGFNHYLVIHPDITSALTSFK